MFEMQKLKGYWFYVKYRFFSIWVLNEPVLAIMFDMLKG
jgi:hypothetical protein